MKHVFLLSMMFGAMPFISMAQDDMYFNPSMADDETTFVSKDNVIDEPSIYYGGISKSEEEYNRRGKSSSAYRKIGVDSLGNDIFMSHIRTIHGDSVVLDTIYGGFTRKYEADDDDFAYSRRMNRFEGFWGWYNPWVMSRPYYYAGWGWGTPYYGWYDTWSAPWFYGTYGYPYYGYSYYSNPYYYGYAGYGWYGPWRGYYGWGSPFYGFYGPRRGYYIYNGHTGTANHWDNAGRSFGHSNQQSGVARGNFRGYRGYNSRSGMTGSGRGQFGTNSSSRNMDSYRGRFGGSRQSYQDNQNYARPGNTGTNTRSTFSRPSGHSFGNATRSTFGGGNFSGSRGGGNFGGARSGGSFGGHR